MSEFDLSSTSAYNFDRNRPRRTRERWYHRGKTGQGTTSWIRMMKACTSGLECRVLAVARGCSVGFPPDVYISESSACKKGVHDVFASSPSTTARL